MANKALNKKRAGQAALKTVKTITIKNLTLEASEEVLQRLAALLTYQDPTRPALEIEDLGPLPFDEQPPKNPQPLELDYAAIRRDIRKHLTAYTEKFGAEAAKTTLSRYGGRDGQPVPDGDHLLDLLAEIEAASE